MYWGGVPAIARERTLPSATRIQDWNHEDSFAGGTHVSISRMRRVVTGVRTSVPVSYVHVRVLPSGDATLQNNSPRCAIS
jgi:hypothetical protein